MDGGKGNVLSDRSYTVNSGTTELTVPLSGRNVTAAGSVWELRDNYAVAPNEGEVQMLVALIEAYFELTGIEQQMHSFPENMRSDVYNLQGVLIKKMASREDIMQLPAGIYIVGNRKVYIRR